MIDKAALLTRRIGEADHEIENFGTVRIRALTRLETIGVQSLPDVAAQDRRTVSLALLEPTLTEDEVRIWQENSGPMEIELLIRAIRDLSGLNEGAAKSGVSGVRG